MDKFPREMYVKDMDSSNVLLLTCIPRAGITLVKEINTEEACMRAEVGVMHDGLCKMLVIWCQTLTQKQTNRCF